MSISGIENGGESGIISIISVAISGIIIIISISYQRRCGRRGENISNPSAMQSQYRRRQHQCSGSAININKSRRQQQATWQKKAHIKMA